MRSHDGPVCDKWWQNKIETKLIQRTIRVELCVSVSVFVLKHHRSMNKRARPIHKSSLSRSHGEIKFVVSSMYSTHKPTCVFRLLVFFSLFYSSNFNGDSHMFRAVTQSASRFLGIRKKRKRKKEEKIIKQWEKNGQKRFTIAPFCPFRWRWVPGRFTYGTHHVNIHFVVRLPNLFKISFTHNVAQQMTDRTERWD